MLVLGRKIGEEVILTLGSETIRVVVLGHQNGQTRLGFDAPRTVRVDRLERHEERGIMAQQIKTPTAPAPQHHANEVRQPRHAIQAPPETAPGEHQPTLMLNVRLFGRDGSDRLASFPLQDNSLSGQKKAVVQAIEEMDAEDRPVAYQIIGTDNAVRVPDHVIRGEKYPDEPEPRVDEQRPADQPTA